MADEPNDRTVIELRAMARIYETRGQAQKAQELLELAERIEQRIEEQPVGDSRQFTQ